MPGAIIPIPLFTYILKDGSGCVFLQAGKDVFLPMFTSTEYAGLFRQREGQECLLVELKTKDDIRAFIEKPPSRSNAGTTDFRIMLDPIAPDTGDFTVFNREDLLNAIPSE